jgi:hypothetical protein
MIPTNIKTVRIKYFRYLKFFTEFNILFVKTELSCGMFQKIVPLITTPLPPFIKGEGGRGLSFKREM